jgi:hypothetical protein
MWNIIIMMLMMMGCCCSSSSSAASRYAETGSSRLLPGGRVAATTWVVLHALVSLQQVAAPAPSSLLLREHDGSSLSKAGGGGGSSSSTRRRILGWTRFLQCGEQLCANMSRQVDLVVSHAQDLDTIMPYTGDVWTGFEVPAVRGHSICYLNATHTLNGPLTHDPSFRFSSIKHSAKHPAEGDGSGRYLCTPASETAIEAWAAPIRKAGIKIMPILEAADFSDWSTFHGGEGLRFFDTCAAVAHKYGFAGWSLDWEPHSAPPPGSAAAERDLRSFADFLSAFSARLASHGLALSTAEPNRNLVNTTVSGEPYPLNVSGYRAIAESGADVLTMSTYYGVMPVNAADKRFFGKEIAAWQSICSPGRLSIGLGVLWPSWDSTECSHGKVFNARNDEGNACLELALKDMLAADTRSLALFQLDAFGWPPALNGRIEHTIKAPWPPESWWSALRKFRGGSSGTAPSPSPAPGPVSGSSEASAGRGRLCPPVAPDAPRLPPVLSGTIEYSSKIVTFGKCCANYKPPARPPPPPHRLARMTPCQQGNELQQWQFTSAGRYPPPGSLTLRGATHGALACATSPASKGGPILLQTCSGDTQAEPAQRWAVNGSEIEGGFGNDGCLNIRENTKKIKGEETGDIHVVNPCTTAKQQSNPALHWRYDTDSGHIVSECTEPAAHCHQWAGQCMTADAVVDSTVLPVVTAAESPTLPIPTDGSCSDHYYYYGDPACVVSTNDTLLCILCGNRNPKTADSNQWEDTVLRRSFDRGRTWQPIQTVYHWPGNNASGGPSTWKTTCGHAPVLDRDTGTIWLGVGFNSSGMLMTHSTDHGECTVGGSSAASVKCHLIAVEVCGNALSATDDELLVLIRCKLGHSLGHHKNEQAIQLGLRNFHRLWYAAARGATQGAAVDDLAIPTQSPVRWLSHRTKPQRFADQRRSR